MVHRRTVGDETLMFGVHGALWGNAMTWWDHGTGSIWSQPLGEAIAGPRKGETVEGLSSRLTTWEAWVETFPDTLALAVEAGPSRFDLDQMAIVVDFGDETAAYVVQDLWREGVVNDTVAGAELAVVADPANPQRWTVFSRTLDQGTVVVLEFDGSVLRDRVSGTAFDPVRGSGIDGPLEGEVLGRLPGFTSFPADVDTFWPDARFWTP